MEVLLLKDVDNLGHSGDVKKVSDGYARNYLVPRGLAVAASPGAIKKAREDREANVRRQARILSEAQAMAATLDGVAVTFKARAGEGDKLYGSITNANIAAALSDKIGQEVDKRKIELEDPIKELGTHAVTIRLGPGAEAKVTVLVERED